VPTRHISTSVMPVLSTGNTRDLADLCRSAALGFLANARDWDKRKLAEWLENSYRPLVVGVANRARRRLTPAYGAPPAPTVQIDALAQMLQNAHTDVLRQLRELAAAPSSLDAGRAFISGSIVTRCMDDIGESGWAPVSHRASLLADRVMSLFAADFLARPWDYEYDLAICGECETVSFGEVSCCRAKSGTQLVAKRAVMVSDISGISEIESDAVARAS
ncbi:MAG: hypothetical protein ABI461_11000, partial [Polyangiaceae bacterium]